MKNKLTWIPNTLTLGNLTLGFISILIASEVSLAHPNPEYLFTLAGVFIVIAALFDGFDGMVARALDATSELGADLDSLADLTTFGIAPGVLMYQMIFYEFKMDFMGNQDFFPVGMLIAALFPICAAYRLARFNVASEPGSFTGLPSPVAGVIVGMFPIANELVHVPIYLSILVFILVALLMVSTIKYSKPQVAIKEKFTWSKLVILMISLGIVLAIIGPSFWPWIAYGVIFFYVFSGIISFIIHAIQEFKV